MTTESQITRTEEIEIICEPREPMTAEKVKDLLEDAGHETRRYSGRAMYGRQCLAVVTDAEAADVVVDAMERCAMGGDAESVVELARFLHGSRTDSMGRGTVIYWPNIDWADCGAEEEEDDCDDGGFRHTGEHDSVRSSGREDFHSDG